MKYRHFILAGLLALGTPIQAQVVINELMQSNIDCIMDDLNEFPDSWVELYNSGTEAVNLKDYKLGVKDKAAKAWQLPNKTLQAKAYIVVYCDKEENGLHTDSRLETGKDGGVYLFQGDEIVDKVEKLAKMPAPNIAYGRKTDGADNWGYQTTPTPGKTNCGKICTDILGTPVFSQKGSVFTSSQTIQLTLSMPEGTPDGTVIRYTTDGKEPTASSTAYRDPISINSNKVIRAKLFCDGYLSPISTAQSYIFLDREMTIPVISIVTDDRYMNDNAIGIIRNNTSKDNKKDWRRPINIEMFDAPGSESVINQLCETRVMGGQSREHALKSLAVYANKRFGTSRFEYEFFPDQKPGLTDFKSIMLRNAGNDFGGLYMRDAIIQRVMAQNADLDWQAWRPAVIFLNGTHKGMLNIRERSNDDNIYTNYRDEKGKGLEDIDMVEISQENSKMVEELKAGTLDNYNAFKEFYNQAGHTMAEYEEIMDCQEFINLMIMNLYYCNLDFPGNNIVVWRPIADGGRWRWISKDTDFGIGLYGRNANYNTIEWIYNNKYDQSNNWANTSQATQLFRSLMADADFNREFIDHTAIYMGDFLNERGTRAIWDPMAELVKPELVKHREAVSGGGGGGWWGGWGWQPNYEQEINNEINNARNWLSQRTNYFYTFVANYYKLGTPTPLVINKDLTEEVTTIVNGVTIRNADFDGKFFANRQLTVEGKGAEGREVKGWIVEKTQNNNTTSTTEVNEPVYTFTMPSCKKLKLTAIMGTADGINDLAARDWNWRIDGHQLTVSGVSSGTNVMLYDVRGMLLGKVRGNGADIRIPLTSRNQMYVLKVGAETVKIR
ncbi:MAG: CotH kinase family protein [Prevotella sp.]|nr:CotH kinase family protein [Prevotella sp.]